MLSCYAKLSSLLAGRYDHVMDILSSLLTTKPIRVFPNMFSYFLSPVTVYPASVESQLYTWPELSYILSVQNQA